MNQEIYDFLDDLLKDAHWESDLDFHGASFSLLEENKLIGEYLFSHHILNLSRDKIFKPLSKNFDVDYIDIHGMVIDFFNTRYGTGATSIGFFNRRKNTYNYIDYIGGVVTIPEIDAKQLRANISNLKDFLYREETE